MKAFNLPHLMGSAFNMVIMARFYVSCYLKNLFLTLREFIAALPWDKPRQASSMAQGQHGLYLSCWVGEPIVVLCLGSSQINA